MKWYWWVLVIIFVILELAMIPANASKASLLGYYAHCSFTPVSTIICWVNSRHNLLAGKRKAQK